MVLNAESLEQDLIRDTLNIVLKYEKDIHKARENLRQLASGVA